MRSPVAGGFRIGAAAVAVLVLAGSRADAGPLYDVTDLGRTLPVGINASGQVIGYRLRNFSGDSRIPILYNSSGPDSGRRIALGDPAGSSSVTALNDSGQVVGSSSTADGNTHAFLYSEGRMRDLGALGGPTSAPGDGGPPIYSYSEARAVNNTGQVAGNSSTADGSTHASLYSGGRMNDLGVLGSPTYDPGDGSPPMPSGGYSEAKAINNAGQVVGSSSTADGSTHAFLYSEGRIQDLGALGGPTSAPGDGGPPIYSYSEARAINNAGQVVGSSSTADGSTHAFLFSDGRMHDLGALGGPTSAPGDGSPPISSGYSAATAINNAGQVIGDSSTADGSTHAFLYSDGQMHDLGTLGGGFSSAVAINSLGRVVGESVTTADGLMHPFLYADGKLSDLNSLILPDSGWTLEGVVGINDAGQIIAYGTDANDYPHGFLLSPDGSSALPAPIPEPTTLSLFGLILAGALRLGRRAAGAGRRRHNDPPARTLPEA